jgi:hypothetical protein
MKVASGGERLFIGQCQYSIRNSFARGEAGASLDNTPVAGASRSFDLTANLTAMKKRLVPDGESAF